MECGKESLIGRLTREKISVKIRRSTHHPCERLPMKLGSQTGSLVNHCLTTGLQTVPVVGMGGSLCFWTDRHAVEVIAWDEKTLTVQVREMTAEVVGGSGYGDEEYKYHQNEKGEVHTYRFKKGWRKLRNGGKNGKMLLCKKGDGPGLSLGRAESYRDPCF